MSDTTFDVNLFIKESRAVLVNPKAYFSGMKTTGGMTEPLIKAVIYGAISGALAFIWSFLRVGAMTNGLLGSATGAMTFVWTIIGAIIGLFIGSIILLVISSICKGNTDFEANMRVVAAVMVVMPIRSVFGLVGHFSMYAGLIIGLLISIYALWLLYNGLVEALKSNSETAKIVTYVLVAIFVIFTLVGFGATKRTHQLFNELNEKGVSETMRELPRN
jgi:hypothetical protein